MTTQEALFRYTLRLADNALILGHRLSEWSSNAPLLEEDIALTNIALDLIGRSQALYKYAAQIEGKGRSEDDLVYKRPERQFYNNLLLEQPNGDFAFTVARQLFNSSFEIHYFEELKKSTDKTLSGIAEKTVKEVKYHLRHATDWMLRLGDGTAESHRRLQDGVNDLWMYTGELFEMGEVDATLIADGIAIDLASLKPRWTETVGKVIADATLTQPQDGYIQTGSRKGVHSEHLGFILAEMQYLQRAYPDASW